MVKMVNLVTGNTNGKDGKLVTDNINGKLGDRLQMVKMVSLVTENTDGKDDKPGDREYRWLVS